jgi:hypothetical protein
LPAQTSGLLCWQFVPVKRLAAILSACFARASCCIMDVL